MKKNRPPLNVFAGVGAGKFRQPFRIKEFLASNGLNMNSIAIELGVHHSLVGSTVMGTKNNKKVLNHLLSLGCPKEYLSMPEIKY